MYFIQNLKNLGEKLPYSIGRCLSAIPFDYRMTGYSKAKKEILKVNQMSSEQKQFLVLRKIKELTFHAYQNTIFYKHHYDKHGFSPSSINEFDDIKKIPIVTKKDFSSFDITERSCEKYSAVYSNTGGTSGQPLDFYFDGNGYSREWAHIHNIWEQFEYKPTDLKLTIRGKNIGSRPYRYNFNQNEFLINAYRPLSETIASLKKNVLSKNIKYIHGYPSSIAHFLHELIQIAPEEFELLRLKVKCVFLGSEYPAPIYRDFIETTCGLQTISWYGHSEMATLATEKKDSDQFYYHPFLSYGYSEAIETPLGFSLVATSYDNYATPFIRYDTGDLIAPNIKDGFLNKFQISSGRIGEIVIDNSGKHISLTAIIFGRHHQAFNYANHIQVSNPSIGKLIIYITTSNENEDLKWNLLFDFSLCDFDIEFKTIESPRITQSGKIPLLIK